jgi:signal transduction histidine kinase
MKLKIKILHKVFIFSIGLISLVITGITFLNNNFLEEYYANKRIEQIEKVRNLLTTDGVPSEEEIETYSQKYNMIIYLKNYGDKMVMMNRNSMNRRPKKYEFNEKNEGNRVVKHMGLETLEYYKLLPSNQILILRISMDSIRSTVGIVNEFFLYGSLIILFISLFFAYLFSKKLTAPILDLNDIIKKMVKMDFTSRSNFKSGDELEELGDNVNYLASQLEMNIDNLKITNMKLVEEIEKKKKIDELRKEFIASITHEIKTPITVINTHAEMLLYDLVKDKVEIKEYLKTIMSEGENISSLLNELIKLIKLEENIIEIKKEKIDISKLLREECEKYRVDIDEKDIKLKLNVEENVEVKADLFKIKQVITNLMTNAISYVNIGGELTVNLFSKGSQKEQNNGEVIVEIINSGSKIPEDKIENIWKAFYRVEKSRNKKYGGVGLGLTIVKGILERHYSKYGVENLENGVKFWFTLEIINENREKKWEE